MGNKIAINTYLLLLDVKFLIIQKLLLRIQMEADSGWRKANQSKLILNLQCLVVKCRYPTEKHKGHKAARSQDNGTNSPPLSCFTET